MHLREHVASGDVRLPSALIAATTATSSLDMVIMMRRRGGCAHEAGSDNLARALKY